jgi:hypothetical protein
MYFTKSTYANRLAEIDVSCDGCGTDVIPIWIIGSEFLERGGFDDIDPGGDFDFTLTHLLASIVWKQHIWESWRTGSF